jgi:hypothetical protein
MNLNDMLLTVSAGQAMGAKRRRFGQSMDDFMAYPTCTAFDVDTQVVCHGFVCTDNSVPIIQNCDQVRNRVEGSFPFFLSPEDRFLDLFMLGDIAEIPDDPVRLPVRTRPRNISPLEKLKLTT